MTIVTDSKKDPKISTALQLLVEMRGLLFLFSALFLLEPTKGGNYENLTNDDKAIVDKAIEQGNKFKKHLDFYEIRERHNNMFEVILRPTSCDKTTPSVHQEHCETYDEPPRVSCICCNGNIMEPCLFLRQTEEIKQKKNECRHYTGAGHMLYHKEEDKQLTGCLGCI